MEPLGAFCGRRLAVGARVIRVALSRDTAWVHSILSRAVSVSWFCPLLIRSTFTLVRNICLEVARILPVRLLGVENEAVRAERPPGFAFHAGPVLVALLGVLEDVGV